MMNAYIRFLHRNITAEMYRKLTALILVVTLATVLITFATLHNNLINQAIAQQDEAQTEEEPTTVVPTEPPTVEEEPTTVVPTEPPTNATGGIIPYTCTTDTTPPSCECNGVGDCVKMQTECRKGTFEEITSTLGRCEWVGH